VVGEERGWYFDDYGDGGLVVLEREVEDLGADVER